MTLINLFYLLSSGSQNATESEDAPECVNATEDISSDFQNEIVEPDSDDEALNATCIDSLDFMEKNTRSYISGSLGWKVKKKKYL